MESVDRRRTCACDGCDTPPRQRGYCAKHAYRIAKYGTPYMVSIRGRDSGKVPRRICVVITCGRHSAENAYCTMHALRVRRHGSPDDPRPPLRQCPWPECSEVTRRSLCVKHQKHLDVTRRRAIRKNAKTIAYSPDALWQRMAYFGHKCWMCGGSFEAVDHVIPLTKGGVECLANLRPACRSCNSRKHNKWHGVSELHRFLKP